MTKKATLTVTLPDGTTAKRTTHIPYTHVVAVLIQKANGTRAWSDIQWSRSEANAQKAINGGAWWARNLLRKEGDGAWWVEFRVVPVNKPVVTPPATARATAVVHTEVRSINGLDFKITIYDAQSKLPLGNYIHAFVWNEYAQERYQAFAERTEAGDEWDGHTWSAWEDSVEDALTHLVELVERATEPDEQPTEPHTLNTADLKTQHEYALYVGSEPAPETLQVQSDASPEAHTTPRVNDVVELSYAGRIAYGVVREILPAASDGRTLYVEIFTVIDGGRVNWDGVFVDPTNCTVRPQMNAPKPKLNDLDLAFGSHGGSDERVDDRERPYWYEGGQQYPQE